MEVEFKIIVKVPAELEGKVTEDQVCEWVEFCTGRRGGISMENPLHEYDLVASDVTPY